MHVHDGTFEENIENWIDVRFFYGHWFKRVVQWGGRIKVEQPASREDIMMVLENMDLLLIRCVCVCVCVLCVCLFVYLPSCIIQGSSGAHSVLSPYLHLSNISLNLCIFQSFPGVHNSMWKTVLFCVL